MCNPSLIFPYRASDHFEMEADEYPDAGPHTIKTEL